MSDGASDEALMGRYREHGDEAAFEALFSRYARRLHAFFARFSSYGGNDPSDLVQKTFLHVHRARRDYQPDRPFRPWVYTIALNVRREEGRRKLRSRERVVDLQDPKSGLEPSVAPQASTASDRLVQRALLQLSEIQREVIVLHWFDGLSFPEIAMTVGASVSAVKVRAHRGYGELRRILGGELG